MLLASGDYKSYRSLRHWDKYPSIESDDQETAKDAHLDKLEGNFCLLDFHAKVPQPTPEGDIFQAITNIVGKLSSEPDMGSTETQMVSLCLTILGELEDSLGESVTKRLKEEYVKQAFSWNQVYHRLLSENRIWDLRDILVAAVSLFGTSFLAQLLGVASFPEALDKIYEDWKQPETENDESTNLGLLDLFTSLLLEAPCSTCRDRKPALLLEYSKSLAESVQSINHQHMKTRPFIQWIIAKAISEMGAVPGRPDGLLLQDFSGLLLRQRRGVHLPIFIPVQPSDKPHWDMFSVRPNPQQRQVLQVALQAARYIGDYRLQAISLKLLILNSQEPKALMDALANLQLDTQGDHEGFLETCLSKYLALGSNDDVDRAVLTSSFSKLDNILRDNHTETSNCKPFYAPKASFLWARDVVTRLVAAIDSDYDGDFDTAEHNIEFWNMQLAKYGARLPTAVTDFIRTKYNVRIPTPIQPASIQASALRRPSPIPGEFTHSSYPNAQYVPLGVSGQPPPHFLGNPGHLNEPMDDLSPMNPFGPFTHPGPPPPPPPPPAESRYYGVSPPNGGPRYPGPPPGPPTEPTGTGFYGVGPSSGGRQYLSHHNDPKIQPSVKKTGAEMQGIPEMDDQSEDYHWGAYPKHDKGPVTAGTPQKKANYIKPNQRRWRTTIHIDPSHPRSSSDTESSRSNSYDISDLSDSTYLRRYKPPAPAPSDVEPSGTSGQSANEDHSDLESEPSITRIMTPSISITKVGNQQNLKIVSELLEDNEMSILMTNKADPTKSKAYTVKNGVISKTTVPGPEGITHETPPIMRTKSQSSLKTVRPRPALPLPPRGGSPCERTDGPAVVNEKEVTDEESTLSGRVHRAESYMNQKADEWLRDNKAKSRRPSIVQPRPVRPTVPGGLANAILTDDEETRPETGVYSAVSAKDAERPSMAPEYLGSHYNDPSDSELPPMEASTGGESFDLKGKKNNEPGHQPLRTEHERLEDQFSKLPERLVGRFERTRSQGLTGEKMPAEGGSVTLVGENIHFEDEVGKKGQNERREKRYGGQTS